MEYDDVLICYITFKISVKVESCQETLPFLNDDQLSRELLANQAKFSIKSNKELGAHYSLSLGLT